MYVCIYVFIFDTLSFFLIELKLTLSVISDTSLLHRVLYRANRARALTGERCEIVSAMVGGKVPPAR